MKNSFEVYQLNKNNIDDFQKLIAVFKEVFETKEMEEAKKSKLIELLDDDDFVALVIKTGKQVIGGIAAYKIKSYYTTADELFLFDIAVQKKFQRKGAGKLLINYLKKYCSKNKIRLMFVEVNKEDKHAINFYTSTASTSEKVIQFNYDIETM